jgi:hypothetical protein
MKGKMQVGYQKTQNLMLISNPLRKLQKDSWKKSYQPTSDQKMEILTSITLCKSLRPFTFINIISYRILANIFECAFISSFLDKRLKKTKNVYYKCVLESHFTSISGREAPFVKKWQNRCTLMASKPS